MTVHHLGRTARLTHHLRFTAQVSLAWLDACEAALDAVQEGDPDRRVLTPAGGMRRASGLVTDLQLGRFVGQVAA